MANTATTVDELAINVAANADVAAASIDKLTAALGRLSRVLPSALGGMKNLSPTLARAANNINGVTSRVQKVAATPIQSVNPVSTTPVAATGAVSAVSSANNKVAQSAKNATSAIQKQTSAIARLGKAKTSVDTLGGSFIQLRSSIFFAFFAIGALVRGFQATAGQSASAIETLNLFNLAFGELSSTAAEWVALSSRNLGLDPNAFAKTAATFMEMNRAMGITMDTALTMSKNLTQLSYDYASLFDVPFEQAAEKFRSAMAGQTRAVRTFGLDVTMAALQDEIYAEGLNYKVNQLNRASKAILIHNALLRNSTRAQGDLARTLSSPSNMMRILGDQVRVTALSIGYMFIPLLQAALPWLIYLAQAANTAARSIAGLFGIEVPSWDSFTSSVANVGGGISGVGDGMQNVADATGAAADNAKKLRDYTLGIDELNILSPDTPTSGGSGGGGGGGGVGGGIPDGLRPFDVYDFGTIDALKKLVEPIKKMFDSAKTAISPFIDALGRLWDALLPFAKNVWAGFTGFWRNTLLPLAAWTMNTVGVGLLETLRWILQWFNEHPDAAKGIGAALAAFTALKGLDVALGVLGKLGDMLVGVFAIKNLGGIITSLKAVGGVLLGVLGKSGILGAVAAFVGTIAGALGISFAAAAALVVAAVGIIVGAVVLVVKRWDDIKAAAGTLATKVSEAWSVVFEDTAKVWRVIVGVMKTAWAGIKAAVAIPLAIIGTLILNAWAYITRITRPAWEYVRTAVWNPLRDLYYEKIRPVFLKIGEVVRNTWSGLKDGLASAWTSIKSVFKSGANALIGIINRGPVRAINDLIKGIKRFDKTGIMKGVGLVPTIPYLAAGGAPSLGQMFVAGEAGPEIIGSFGGNNNTVMPLENSGFVDAMHSAVFKAVAAAMSGVDLGGGSGDVYLDGDKVGKTLSKSEYRSGTHTSLVRVTR